MQHDPKPQQPPPPEPVEEGNESIAGEEDPGAADDLIVSHPPDAGTSSRPGDKPAETPAAEPGR